MNKLFKRLFCKHNYERVEYIEFFGDGKEARWYGFKEEFDPVHVEKYDVREYQCSKCGKRIWVDSRYNPYSEY